MPYDGEHGVDEDQECVVPTCRGEAIVFQNVQANTNGTDYVRFIDESTQKELAYWTSSEWEEEPELVMGAIMACLQVGARARQGVTQ